ncbi:MAG: hypothetical protein WKG32_00140 [Gemmatimonadaceae bacterium]
MRTPIAFLLLLLAAACSDDPAGPPGGDTPSGAIVLNGVGAVGVTIVPDTGSTFTHIDITGPFDGAFMTVRGDSVLTATSVAAGDLLYVLDVGARTVRALQLPASSNPSGSAFLPGVSVSGTHEYAVALRNARTIARVTLPATGAAQVTQLSGAGRCPYDVAFAQGALWSADANLACESDYAPQGAGRLIRVPLTGTARDTIPLGAAVQSPTRVIVVGGFAYVLASGGAATPAAIAKVDLGTRSVVATLPFSQGAFGVNMSLGRDGVLYAIAANEFAPYTTRAYSVDPATLAFRGPFFGATSRRLLTLPGGGQAACAAASADAAGRVYCVENGETQATLRVFEANGAFVRSVAAGSLGFDISVR